ncbi:MAG: 50S ribosomal protein L29 [Wenzhouxiangella sp.]|nr:50S ribosomal protein L29 [Wenzhouxiangella sp.]MCH8478472.1 50S ribosomal protein L29 [Wenzhouxiangella sp.]TVR94979.1 MAG: 50S ribosomal protein L29 [Wenzhouxiangellaceae bacterium]
MKASELRAKNAAELKDLLLELRKEQFSLRMQHGNGTLEARHELKRVRREIARVKTVMNQIQGEAA